MANEGRKDRSIKRGRLTIIPRPGETETQALARIITRVVQTGLGTPRTTATTTQQDQPAA